MQFGKDAASTLVFAALSGDTDSWMLNWLQSYPWRSD